VALAEARAKALELPRPPWGHDDGSVNADYRLVDVAEDTDEFEEVRDRFFNNGFRKAVLRVQQVQNKALWDDYQFECKRIRRKVSCAAVPCRAVPCRAVPCRDVPCRDVPCRAVP
jgi:hypothetical protein